MFLIPFPFGLSTVAALYTPRMVKVNGQSRDCGDEFQTIDHIIREWNRCAILDLGFRLSLGFATAEQRLLFGRLRCIG
jgi:hypothetical protein